VMLARVCEMCDQPFEVERKRGRPRLHCYDCVPQGMKLVRLPHRVKLRRVNPLMPRIPARGLAQVYRIAP
jgi:hypothetical protein